MSDTLIVSPVVYNLTVSAPGPQGTPGAPGVVQAISAADSTITVAGTAANPTVKVNTIAESQVTNLTTDLAAKAPKASPTFTGTVTTPLTTAGVVKTSSAGVLSSVATLGNSDLTNSSVTVNGSTIALGGSATVTATPTAHASTHGVAGSDPVTIAPTQVTGTAVITTDSRLSDSRTPTGTAGGDLTGTYPNPTLGAVGTAGTYGSASQVPVIVTDSKGRVTGVTNTAIQVAESQVTNLTTDLAAKAPAASPTFTGTVTTPLTTAGVVKTSAAGVLSSVATLANTDLTNSSVTVNGSSVALGGSVTVTANPNAHASTHTAGGSDPVTIATSQVSWAAIANWQANTSYTAGDLVQYQGVAYRRISNGTSGATFAPASWNRVTPLLSDIATNITGIAESSVTNLPTDLGNKVDWASLESALDSTTDRHFTTPRRLTTASLTPTSGTVYLSFFTAVYATPVNYLQLVVGATGFSGGNARANIGLYTWNGTTGTLVTSTGMNAISSSFFSSGNVIAKGSCSSYTLIPGQRYAIAFVSQTTAGNLQSNAAPGSGLYIQTTPYIAGTTPSVSSDLPTSFTTFTATSTPLLGICTTA